MARSTAVLILTAAFLASCTGGEQGDPRGTPTFTMTDSAGIELAITDYTGPIVTGWTIAEEPTVVFGESAGELVEFSRIRGATRLADGRVVAVDDRAAEIYFFGADGSLLARAGGEGDGPGEFRRPTGPAALADTVFFYDLRHMRLSLFTLKGEFIEDRRLEVPTGEGAARLGQYELADATAEAIILTPGLFVMAASAGDHVSSSPTLRFQPRGSFVGTTAEPTKMWLVSNGASVGPKLLGGSQSVEAHAGLVYANDRDRYEVRVHAAGGGLVRIHRLIRPQRWPTAELVRKYKDWRASRIEDPERRRAVMRSMDASAVADTIAWISSMTIDALGHIWVGEYAISEGRSSVRGVFSSAGPWLGTVILPDRVRPIEIGEDYLLAAVTDELDIQRLALFELSR